MFLMEMLLSTVEGKVQALPGAEGVKSGTFLLGLKPRRGLRQGTWERKLSVPIFRFAEKPFFFFNVNIH